ncbi:putative nucleotidyltransferase [Methanolinea mesophila]|uniref:DNA polymerase subunit beta n=1 Tax=Methanolinea mesophila TaxID=547055 RepID=UPI001AEB4C31|nr:DNA polymerase subunit beta [Methanolinea mesophila]MBP1927618.1 putative nucleotidyltransferase [Methanolinea mesophila]
MNAKKPIRLRDFVEDRDGWLYAVSAYDNADRVGCVLRYVPDPRGERSNREGQRYRKLEFEEAYALIASEKPSYSDRIQRVPYEDIRRVFKPEEELPGCARRDRRIGALLEIFGLPPGCMGITGSFLCGLEIGTSDIDLVVYGPTWFSAQETLRTAISKRVVMDLDDEMWHRVYRKRNPETSFDEFMLHEVRKWNRGVIGDTYFDLLYTRSYGELDRMIPGPGEKDGTMTLRAIVTDASLAFDNPAVYLVRHPEISKVLSFTHTYSGQALAGETIEARGVCERHGGEKWLIVGTTREARGEYIRSLTLLEQQKH